MYYGPPGSAEEAAEETCRYHGNGAFRTHVGRRACWPTSTSASLRQRPRRWPSPATISSTRIWMISRRLSWAHCSPSIRRRCTIWVASPAGCRHRSGRHPWRCRRQRRRRQSYRRICRALKALSSRTRTTTTCWRYPASLPGRSSPNLGSSGRCWSEYCRGCVIQVSAGIGKRTPIMYMLAYAINLYAFDPFFCSAPCLSQYWACMRNVSFPLTIFSWFFRK